MVIRNFQLLKQTLSTGKYRLSNDYKMLEKVCHEYNMLDKLSNENNIFYKLTIAIRLSQSYQQKPRGS